MPLKINSTMKKHIKNIEKQFSGAHMKSAIRDCFADMQDPLKSGFKALTLNGKDISEFVTQERLLKTFNNENDQIYDTHPIKDSKKACESGGYLDYFGDMNQVYRSIIAREGENNV